MPDSFERAERLALLRELEEGGELRCPRCSALLDRRPVPPRRDVSYVRDRLWVVCPSCHRTAVLDRREDR